MLEDKAGQGGYNKDVNMKNMVALLQQPFDCSRLKAKFEQVCISELKPPPEGRKFFIPGDEIKGTFTVLPQKKTERWWLVVELAEFTWRKFEDNKPPFPDRFCKLYNLVPNGSHLVEAKKVPSVFEFSFVIPHKVAISDGASCAPPPVRALMGKYGLGYALAAFIPFRTAPEVTQPEGLSEKTVGIFLARGQGIALPLHCCLKQLFPSRVNLPLDLELADPNQKEPGFLLLASLTSRALLPQGAFTLKVHVLNISHKKPITGLTLTLLRRAVISEVDKQPMSIESMVVLKGLGQATLRLNVPFDDDPFTVLLRCKKQLNLAPSGECDVLFTSEDTKLPHPIHPCLHSFEGELLHLTYLLRLQLEIDGSSVSAEKILEIPMYMGLPCCLAGMEGTRNTAAGSVPAQVSAANTAPALSPPGMANSAAPSEKPEKKDKQENRLSRDASPAAVARDSVAAPKDKANGAAEKKDKKAKKLSRDASPAAVARDSSPAPRDQVAAEPEKKDKKGKKLPRDGSPPDSSPPPRDKAIASGSDPTPERPDKPKSLLKEPRDNSPFKKDKKDKHHHHSHHHAPSSLAPPSAPDGRRSPDVTPSRLRQEK